MNETLQSILEGFKVKNPWNDPSSEEFYFNGTDWINSRGGIDSASETLSLLALRGELELVNKD